MSSVLFATFKWWFVVGLVGWVAAPLAWRLFPGLPDRGLAFIRPLGLLVAGYVYWLLGMAGMVPNSAAGAWFVVLGLVFAGAWIGQPTRSEALAWLRARRRLVLGYEALFLVGLAGWAIYRSYSPNIETSGGEKYMEMAFISGVLESPQLPPLDPWMSGHTISYYYFAYVIAALLIHLTGIVRFEAFNLLVPLSLGLTLCGAFGLGYNLVALSKGATRAARLVGGGFTAFLLPLAGSLEGALELAYLRGWGSAGWYNWLDVMNLTIGGGTCAEEPGSGFGAGGWVPTRFIWWWRASRVIHDGCGYVINEFPFFSFMLADAHPHVLALPFALMVLGLALAVLAGGWDPGNGERPLWSPRWLALPLLVGALGFLNTWDLPTYGFVVVVAYGLRALGRSAAAIDVAPTLENRALAVLGALGVAAVAWRGSAAFLEIVRQVPPDQQPLAARALLAGAVTLAAVVAGRTVWGQAAAGSGPALRAVDTARFAIWLAALSILFFIPFHVGFQSQVSGIGLVDIRTRLPHWLVHFGLLFFLGVTAIVALAPDLRAALRRPGSPARPILVATAAAMGIATFLAAWTALVLVAVIAAAVVVLVARMPSHGDGPADPTDRAADAGGAPDAAPQAADDAGEGPTAPPISRHRATVDAAPAFALVCVAVGLLLPLGTEFVFIRDLFNNRMNSVFKLYYQGWTLLAVGGGYAAYAVWRRWRPAARWGWSAVAAGLVLAALYYPVAATYDRTNRLTVRADGGPEDGHSLDGLRWWKAVHPEDREAVAWLTANTPPGTVILEAYGGGYAHNGRISMATGRPTVMGWEGHEHQWRGVRDEIDPRKADVDAMYKSPDGTVVRDLLRRYGVRFVVLGETERAQFGLTPADERRFEDLLGAPVWTSSGGKVKVFEVAD